MTLTSPELRIHETMPPSQLVSNLGELILWHVPPDIRTSYESPAVLRETIGDVITTHFELIEDVVPAIVNHYSKKIGPLARLANIVRAQLPGRAVNTIFDSTIHGCQKRIESTADAVPGIVKTSISNFLVTEQLRLAPDTKPHEKLQPMPPADNFI